MSKVNVIGASCIDILISGYQKDLLFSNKYKVDSIKTYFGGDALNQAICLSNFNIDSKLVTILGNDYNGNEIVSFLDNKNVKYNTNIFKDNIETYTSLVFIDDNGERVFIGNKDGSVRKLDLDDISIDQDCEIVSFGSLFISQELNNEKLEILFKQIKDRNITLCVDCSTPKNNETIKDMTCLRYVDYFFLNEYEANLLTGQSNIYSIEEEIYKAGVKNVIIKCGKSGAFYKEKYYIDEIDLNPIDTTGAGDNFVAGFIYGLINNQNIENCIKIANKFAYYAIKYIGGSTWLDYIDKGELLI